MQLKPQFKRVRIVDIDGVILKSKKNFDFSEQDELPGSVERINRWFEQGDYIQIWTARSEEYFVWTRDQLDEIGLLYHEICFNKPWSKEIYIYDDVTIRAFKLEKDLGLASLDLEEVTSGLTEGESYCVKLGRMNREAEFVSELREILDPEDKRRLTLSELKAEIKRLKATDYTVTISNWIDPDGPING